MRNNIKIGSIILFSVLFVVVLSLALIIENKDSEEIEFIQLNGNYHLSQNEYLKFAHLENSDSYEGLTVKIIKDRFEKHPYISKVNLLLTETTLNIEIIEKNFEALLMVDGNEYLISDNSIIIPKLPNSEKIDYPIISDPENKESIKEFNNSNQNSDLIVGLKIISALKIINTKLYESLSEVNLRQGRDIILQFSNLNIPIVLGRKKEIEKIILFDKLLEKLDFNRIQNTLAYIDLRYSKYLYVGKENLSNTEQENNSWKITLLLV